MLKNGTLGLAGDGLGQQRLAGARRADQQDALAGCVPPSFWNFCGSFRKSTSSVTSSLASSQPATSAKVVRVVGLVEHAGLALAEAEGAALAAALHLAHEVDPHADQQQHRAPAEQHAHQQERGLLALA
jgi:hypothetical protein